MNPLPRILEKKHQRSLLDFHLHLTVPCRYGEVWGDWHGGSGGFFHEVQLQEEHITAVNLRLGDRIDSLQFVTDKFNFYGPFGGGGGHPEVSAHPECALSYISGTSGARLDSLTLHYECS